MQKCNQLGSFSLSICKRNDKLRLAKKSLLTQKNEAALREHCGQDYSLDDLANDLQRDKFYLAHLYKNETG